MKREEAIQWLETIDALEIDDGAGSIVIALKMAIEALQEQKTGKWIDGNRRQTCSICRYRGMRSWRFCPSCGASMRSEEE